MPTQHSRDWQDEIRSHTEWEWMFGRGGFYAECMGGWRNLLVDLIRKIDAHVQGEWRKGDEDLPGFQVTQVKEKFGTLRFYCWGSDDQIDAWIEEAEEASANTCELCGKEGKIYGHGWYMTRCPEHAPAEGR
ncbi:hypothetical protein [Microvirga calopogonii]|uniref:hypothetical protein n=1 Tax=Microvirga calopogonii TaxID=2078013 RepID=UPI0013B4083B|nr:hypothetical protein [Microvirga calopogonii]